MKLPFLIYLIATIILTSFSLVLKSQNFHRTYYLSIKPSYEAVFSQVEIRAPGLRVGFGTYNHFRFHIMGSLSFAHGSNLKDNYNRKSIFDRFSPAINIKWTMIGHNRYKSLDWFYNIRLCFDAAIAAHISSSRLFNGDLLVKNQLIFYPSVDAGLSLMIPFGYVAKHRSHFLNRSDLYLEITESVIIKNNVSLITSTASKIDDVTLATRIGLNWVYLF